MNSNELYHFNHNHDPRTGQFTFGRGRVVVYKSKSKSKSDKPSIIQRVKESKERKRQAQIDARKKAAIDSGDPFAILRDKEHYTTQELKEAADRIRAIGNLEQERHNKVDHTITKTLGFARTVRDFAQVGADIYRNVDSIKNIRRENAKRIAESEQVNAGKDFAKRAIKDFGSRRVTEENRDKEMSRLFDQLEIAKALQGLDDVAAGRRPNKPKK